MFLVLYKIGMSNSTSFASCSLPSLGFFDSIPVGTSDISMMIVSSVSPNECLLTVLAHCSEAEHHYWNPCPLIQGLGAIFVQTLCVVSSPEPKAHR